MHTPEEAIDELEYARETLGLKGAMLASFVQRPLEASAGTRPATWMDTFGADSLYDYDPVWAKCQALGVAPTFHSSGMGWGSRASISSYVYNHLGNFAAGGDAICRALLLDGVPRRFPGLRFAFLEGGVGWGATLYGDLLGHFEKRNREHIRHYDPAALDRPLLAKLLAEYGSPAIVERAGELDGALRMLSNPEEPADALDEFARSGIECAEDIRDVFERSFFFGCEADDPSNAAAFDTRRNPFGSRLRAIFSSDIGHWDVPDMRGVLHEAWELVEKGLLSEADFRDFVYENPRALWAGSSPEFFRGTVLEPDGVATRPGGTAAG
jgi:predicted TIM-barrel fold metal-dependent hydrolase